MPGRRLVTGAGALALGLAALGVWLAVGSNHAGVAARSAPAGSTGSVAAFTTTPPPTQPRITSAVKPQSADNATAQTTTVPRPSPTPSPISSRGPLAITATSLVATIRSGGAPGSQTPGGPPTREVPGQWLRGRVGAASHRPTTRLGSGPPGPATERIGRLGAQSGDVSLATDSYHIVVDLATMHLQLFKDGQQVASFPAGIGVPGRSHAHRAASSSPCSRRHPHPATGRS